MNISELESRLIKERVLPETYSLVHERKNFAYSIRMENEKWCVFFSERGSELDKTYFETESEACEFLLKRVLSDPTTRARK